MEFFNNCLEIRWHTIRRIHLCYLLVCVWPRHYSPPGRIGYLLFSIIGVFSTSIPSRPNIKILMMCTWFWVITISAEEIHGEINLKYVSVSVSECGCALAQAAACHSYHFILFSIRITKMHISCEAACACECWASVHEHHSTRKVYRRSVASSTFTLFSCCIRFSFLFLISFARSQ